MDISLTGSDALVKFELLNMQQALVNEVNAQVTTQENTIEKVTIQTNTMREEQVTNQRTIVPKSAAHCTNRIQL